MFKYVLHRFFKNKKSYLLIVIIIITFLIMSISPYLTGSFVDFMINNKDVHRVVYLSSIIMLIGIAGVVLAYCKNTLSVKITSQVSFDLLRDITKHFEKVKLSIVETIDSTYLTQQINTDVNVITGFVISNIIPMFMNVILVMAIICLFISINKYLLVLMVVLIVPYIILYANMHQPLYEKFLDKKEADSKFFSKFSSQICQIFNIQLHSLYEVSEKELNHAFGNYLPVLVGAKKIEYIFTSVDSIIATIFQSIMFVIGGISIIHGGMTIGQFTMINTYFGMFLKIVKYYIGYIKELQDSKASFSRIIKIMSYDSLEKGNANVETLEKLSLKNLTFSYLVKGTENVIINKFTCDFYKGKKYAIIGPNGCGKSTLLKIITGLYTEFEGDLEVNGIKMKELDWDKLRKEKFSVVPQRLYLSSDSVIEFLEKGLAKSKKNICITLEKDQEELSEFITTIKMNIDKSCENLSGGELRKINLWMALHKKSDVLILDEPTIELDKSSKEELFEYLKNRIQNKLLIVLTHDKELMGISDYVVDLNSGREVKL